jgi:hypothetical protein
MSGSPPVERRKSPQFRIVYSNDFRYRVTINDVGIIFGNLADIGDGERTLVSTEEILVQMSLGQAKALGEYLAMIVRRYEQTLGPVHAVGKAAPLERELDGMFGILENTGRH